MGCVIMHYLKSYASNSLIPGRGTHDGLVLGEELGKVREPGLLQVGRWTWDYFSSHHKNSIVLNPMMRARHWSATEELEMVKNLC
jgi:hypothetical protein